MVRYSLLYLPSILSSSRSFCDCIVSLRLRTIIVVLFVHNSISVIITQFIIRITFWHLLLILWLRHMSSTNRVCLFSYFVSPHKCSLFFSVDSFSCRKIKQICTPSGVTPFLIFTSAYPYRIFRVSRSYKLQKILSSLHTLYLIFPSFRTTFFTLYLTTSRNWIERFTPSLIPRNRNSSSSGLPVAVTLILRQRPSPPPPSIGERFEERLSFGKWFVAKQISRLWLIPAGEKSNVGGRTWQWQVLDWLGAHVTGATEGKTLFGPVVVVPAVREWIDDLDG